MDNGTTWTPNVLLLGSGGVKGFLTIGSLMFFEKTKLLKNIKKVVGISIGSVVGLFYVIGCSATEILEISLMTQLSEVMTNIDIVNIMKTNGLVSHDVFRKRMNDKVMEKFGFVPTLHQLYMMTGYEFEVVVTNLDKDEAEYFNHQTQPKLSCVEAVLMSMSIPLLFQTYIYNNHIYVDGAICDPFPIHRYSKDKVFGIMLKSTHDDPKESFYNYLAKVIQTFTSTKLKNIEIPPDCKILNLEYKVNDAIGMKVTFEKRVDMVLLGYLRAYQFYSELYKLSPQTYPITIQRYHSLDFFNSLPFDKKQDDMILQYVEQPSEVDTEEMEDEADEYLEELFDSDFTLSESSSETSSSDQEEDSEKEPEEAREAKPEDRAAKPEDRDDHIEEKPEARKTFPEDSQPYFNFEHKIQDEQSEGEQSEAEETIEPLSILEKEIDHEHKENRDIYQDNIQNEGDSTKDGTEYESEDTNDEGQGEANGERHGEWNGEGEREIQTENEIIVPTERRLSERRLSERLSNRMSSLYKTKIYSPGKIISGMKKSKKKYKKKHKKPEWVVKN